MPYKTPPFTHASKPSDIAANLLLPLVAAVESAAVFAGGIRERGAAGPSDSTRSRNFTAGADLAVEMMLGISLSAIDGAAPVVSEGKPDSDGEPGYPRWVVDPIDGTGNYMSNLPYAVSAAYVLSDGSVLAGAVCCPDEGCTYYAAKRFGSYMRVFGEPIPEFRADELRELDKALRPSSSRKAKMSIPAPCGGKRLFVPDYADFVESANKYLERDAGDDVRGCGNLLFGMPSTPSKVPRALGCVASLSPLFFDVKRIGPTSVDICRVAGGEALAFVGIEPEPWDIAAASLVVTEAGGLFSDGLPESLLAEGGEMEGDMYVAAPPELEEILEDELGTAASGNAGN